MFAFNNLRGKKGALKTQLDRQRRVIKPSIPSSMLIELQVSILLPPSVTGHSLRARPASKQKHVDIIKGIELVAHLHSAVNVHTKEVFIVVVATLGRRERRGAAAG